jgi:hypothetical protein
MEVERDGVREGVREDPLAAPPALNDASGHGAYHWDQSSTTFTVKVGPLFFLHFDPHLLFLPPVVPSCCLARTRPVQGPLHLCSFPLLPTFLAQGAAAA